MGSAENQGVSMKNQMRITAIVGSYRKGGVVDTVIDEILDAARAEGAEVAKVYLIDIMGDPYSFY
jgi:multimeric flavodoxin WrbA